jgi:hypothetical protein
VNNRPSGHENCDCQHGEEADEAGGLTDRVNSVDLTGKIQGQIMENSKKC